MSKIFELIGDFFIIIFLLSVAVSVGYIMWLVERFMLSKLFDISINTLSNYMFNHPIIFILIIILNGTAMLYAFQMIDGGSTGL